ncbi:hypothetical protein ACFSQ7_09775 [Paenibacillus rhizoplanae]
MNKVSDRSRKTIEAMLPYTYDELLTALPRQAARCDKKKIQRAE